MWVYTFFEKLRRKIGLGVSIGWEKKNSQKNRGVSKNSHNFGEVTKFGGKNWEGTYLFPIFSEFPPTPYAVLKMNSPLFGPKLKQDLKFIVFY